MKKILSVILLFVCILTFAGCGNEKTDGKIQKKLSSQMILLEQYDYHTGLCYDKDTKIIYMYDTDYTYYGNYVTSYSVYYVMDTNNNPIVGVYYE